MINNNYATKLNDDELMELTGGQCFASPEAASQSPKPHLYFTRYGIYLPNYGSYELYGIFPRKSNIED